MTNLIVLVLAFAIISLVIIEGVDRVNRNILIGSLTNQSEAALRTIKQTLLMDSKDLAAENDFKSRAGEFASRLSRESDIRTLIFSSDKKLLADSEKSESLKLDFKELDEAFNRGGNRAYSERNLDGSAKLFFAFPVIYSGKIIGGIIFINSLDDVKRNRKNISIVILISFFIGIAVIFIVSMILSLRLTKPISELNLSALKISNGDYSSKIDINSKDEVGVLASTFNLMMDEISSKINALNYEKAKLSSVLESMGEGVIAYNESGEIIADNKISRAIIKNINEKDVLRIVDKVKGSSERSVVEISANDKILLVCATPLTLDKAQGGVVLILNDISELRLLQEKQKQFVTNISHELKTPLTTILGYIDLLKERGDNKRIFDTSIEYLQSSGERLQRLVDDLIELSSLKRLQFEIEKRSVDISALIRDTVGQMALKANKFGIVIETELPQVKVIMADPLRIKQAVVNIIDNAIKYSQKGKITVNLYEKQDNILLEIADNGRGIPEELKDKIFEPFYRVDKARSREIGGNGLGLSITKEIIDKHGGEIFIESSLGIGTKVIISLPKE
ncbi:MAG: ATP-binding protein [Bacillota bacterium]|nr:ATP-binding protein [Bacillota bacterium]